MHILGINAYHADASACLVRDGQIVAAVQEERFNRIKYWAGFPTQAIRYSLSAGGIKPGDLDHIAVSRDPSAHLHKKILFALLQRPSLRYLKDRLTNMARVRDVKTAFCDAVETRPQEISAQFHRVEHHCAHMASSFFVSPFEEAAVLSVDGMGDFVSTMWGTGRGPRMEVQGAIYFPHSLGYLYTMVSQWLGFPNYGDEGKVMGLAPYGKPVYMDRMRDLLRIRKDGTFALNLDFLTLHAEGVEMTWDGGTPIVGRMYTDKFLEVFGPSREPRTKITQYHIDVAASLQQRLEEAEFALLERVARETKSKNLCLAGGVALNSTFNGKILPNTPFDEVYIQPASGDAGTALGAAYYIYHEVLGRARRQVMGTAAVGPCFTDAEIAAVLERYGLDREELDTDALCRTGAQLVAAGKVVGWFQGRMEWGPRALGNRSILADPRRIEMKDILNARIKHRESFRPFAPSVLAEATGVYFEQDYPDPFMLKVYRVREEKRHLIPAVVHVDGTGRLQTVSRETAPLYWRLIKAFEEETGVPVILNTSFNEDEPIVCRPEDAIECFLRTHMDALMIGNCVVQKPGIPVAAESAYRGTSSLDAAP